MEVQVRVEGLQEFLKALNQFAPEVRQEFYRQARSVAAIVAADAKARASWSRRIPSVIRTSVTQRSVAIRVTRTKTVPHGPLYERGSKGSAGVVRHPLFGDRHFWFSEPTRPFLKPAADANREATTEAMLKAINDARRGVGLHG